MEFLGIGPMELAFIVLIMFIVLGPDQMVSAARKIGLAIRKIRSSNLWKEVNNLRTLPQTFVNESGLGDIEELNKLNKSIKDLDRDMGAWTGNTIAPPHTTATTLQSGNTQDNTEQQVQKSKDLEQSEAGNAFGAWTGDELSPPSAPTKESEIPSPDPINKTESKTNPESSSSS